MDVRVFLHFPGHSYPAFPPALTALPRSCPSCGVISARVHSPGHNGCLTSPSLGGSKLSAPSQGSSAMSTCALRTRSPKRSPRSRAGQFHPLRLRDALVAAVIGSGVAAMEAASLFGVSWWLVQRALDSAAALERPGLMPWHRGCLLSMNSGMNIPHGRTFSTNRGEPLKTIDAIGTVARRGVKAILNK